MMPDLLRRPASATDATSAGHRSSNTGEGSKGRSAPADDSSSGHPPAVPEPSPELLARAAAGDQSAFRDLVERYQHAVYGAAYVLLGNAQDAEDAAQETFLRLYRGLARYRGEAAFGTWLHRLTVNAAVDQRRRRRRSDRRTEAAGAQAALAPPNVLDASAARREQVRALLGAMAELPPARRKPLVLRDVHGYEYAEIADLLGKPVGTVKAAVHRGRKAVREALERRGALAQEE